MTSTQTFYKHLWVTIPKEHMKHVVGRKGINLKACCTRTGVDSVWYNMERNSIEIYGPSDCLDSAIHYMEGRLMQIREKIPIKEMEEYLAQDNDGEHIQEEMDTYVSSSLHGLISKENIKYVIGKNGYNFKKITKESNVSFIWYDDNYHIITVWGPKQNISKAIWGIFKQIEHINNLSNPIKKLTDLVELMGCNLVQKVVDGVQ